MVNIKKIICIIMLLSLALTGCKNKAEDSTESTPSGSVPTSSETSSSPSSSSTPSSSAPTSSIPSSSETTTSEDTSSTITGKPSGVTKPKPKPKPAPVSSSEPPSSEPVKNSAGQPLDGMQDHQTAEDGIFLLVNELRGEYELPPLTLNARLKNSAYIRSKEMAANDTLTHTRPNGTDFYTAITFVDYNYTYAAENIATMSGYAEKEYAKVLFNGWKESPSYFKAMINSDCTDIGISIYVLDGKVYATQHFAAEQ